MDTTKRRVLGLAVATLVAAGSAGCGSVRARALPPPITTRGVAVAEPAANPRLAGAADTAFGLDVLAAWCRQDPSSNIVFSPESLATGLGMAYLGARGSTARAMARVLHVPAAGRALLADLQARSAALRAMNGPGVRASATDQVWADPSVPTRRQYLNDVATGYGAGVRRVPVLSRPNEAIQQINAAIAGATHRHIPQLLAPGSLHHIAWVLTDALYLAARWATPFQRSQTTAGRFTTAGGQRVSAPFMSGAGFPYARAAGWTAVSLPYQGRKLAMVAMLPDSGARGCPALSPPGLGKITSGLGFVPGTSKIRFPNGNRAVISLPKVSLSSNADMGGLLRRLGMGIAFGGTANFTGLSPDACCIGLVVHAATLRVAEKGTVASAATAVGMQPTAGVYAPHNVSFDRPYLLLVTDTTTGEPLFLARVANPAAP